MVYRDDMRPRGESQARISLALFALFGSSGAYLSSLEMILVGRALLGIAIAGIMTTTIDWYQTTIQVLKGSGL